MKKFLVLTLAAAVFSPAATTARPGVQPPDAPWWAIYTPPGEESSVAMPGMAVLHDTLRSVKGRPKEDGKARAFAAYDDGVVYLVWSYVGPRPGEDVAHFAQYFRSSQL